jgi:hypothetical protein
MDDRPIFLLWLNTSSSSSKKSSRVLFKHMSMSLNHFTEVLSWFSGCGAHRGLTLGESPVGHISRKRIFHDHRYPRLRFAIISSFFTQKCRRLFLFVHDCRRQKELSYSFIHAHLNNLISRYRVSRCERKTRNCAFHACTNPNPALRTFITGGFVRRILPKIHEIPSGHGTKSTGRCTKATRANYEASFNNRLQRLNFLWMKEIRGEEAWTHAPRSHTTVRTDFSGPGSRKLSDQGTSHTAVNY